MPLWIPPPVILSELQPQDKFVGISFFPPPPRKRHSSFTVSTRNTSALWHAKPSLVYIPDKYAVFECWTMHFETLLVLCFRYLQIKNYTKIGTLLYCTSATCKLKVIPKIGTLAQCPYFVFLYSLYNAVVDVEFS